MITNDVENYPGFPEKIAGPELMKAFREQAARQGAEIVTEDVNKVDFSQAPVPRSGSGDDDAEHLAETRHHRDGRAGQVARPRERARAARAAASRACAVCDGAFFRGQDVVRRRRRRHGDGGGDVPVRPLPVGHARPPPRRVPREQDDAGARPREPEDPPVYNAVVDEVLDVGKGEVTGRRASRNVKTGDERIVDRARASSSPSATPRTPTSSPASSTCTTTATSGRGPGTTQTSVAGRLRRRRRPGLHLPPGRHRRRHRLHGRARGRALARRAHRPLRHARAAPHG